MYGISNEYVLFQRTLKLAEVGHGSEALSELLTEIMRRQNIYAVVTDSAPSNPRAVRNAFSEIASERRIDDDDFFWWPCLAHLVHLCQKWASMRMLAGDKAGSGAQSTFSNLTRDAHQQSDMELAIKEAKEEGILFENKSVQELNEELFSISGQVENTSSESTDFSYLIEKAKLCSRAIRQSDTRAALYKKVCAARVPPPRTKIKSSTRTRFSSQLLQFESILDNSAVLKTMAEDPSGIWPSKLYFTGDELQALQCLTATMKKLEELIRVFSMSPSIHGPIWAFVIPSLDLTLDYYKEISLNSDTRSLPRSLAALIHEELVHYIGDIVFFHRTRLPSMYLLAALLDPRSVQWVIGKNYHTIEQYQKALRTIEIWYFDDVPWDSEETIATRSVINAESGSFSEGSKTLIEEALQKCQAAAKDASTNSAPSGRNTGRVRAQIQQELVKFTEEAKADATLANTPPLKVLNYWKDRAVRWPRLSRMACVFAAIPAGSIDVERLFTQTGRHNAPLRRRMSAYTQQRDAVLQGNATLLKRFKCTGR